MSEHMDLAFPPYRDWGIEGVMIDFMDRGHPALPMLARIPTSWDDTKALDGIVGEHIVIARRRGEDWYIVAMNDRRPRVLDVPLRFLGPDRYRAEIYADDLKKETAHGLVRRSEEVAAQDVLKVSLGSPGGDLARLTPLPKEPPKNGK
jgi:alpha-glucosidase